jgi:hypothetical protein
VKKNYYQKSRFSLLSYLALNVLTHPVTLALLTHADMRSSRKCGGKRSVNLAIKKRQLHFPLNTKLGLKLDQG